MIFHPITTCPRLPGTIETSSVAAPVTAPPDSSGEDTWRLRAKPGQVLPPSETRTGCVSPQDGVATGEPQDGRRREVRV
jgi:hypothetical protein